jgi:type II secretory pathway pseudopilin PulG
LIELMIAMVIVSVLVSLALVSALEAKKSSNEASAVAALRTLHSAQETYRERDKDGNGIADYGNIKDLIETGVFGNTNSPLAYWNSAANGPVYGWRHHGYYIWVSPDAWNQWGGAPSGSTWPYKSQTHWQAVAHPVAPQAGTRIFWIDQSGTILVQPNWRSPPLSGSVSQYNLDWTEFVYMVLNLRPYWATPL